MRKDRSTAIDPVETTKIEPAESAVPAPRPTRKLRPRRVLGAGCLVLCLLSCAAVGALVVALQSGPVELALPGNSALKFGSDNYVLSNSSFQDGTTYYADFKAAGL